MNQSVSFTGSAWRERLHKNSSRRTNKTSRIFQILNIIDHQADPKKRPWGSTEALLASYLRLSFQNTCHTVVLIIDFLPMFIYQHEMMGRMGINRTDSGCSFYKIFLKIVIISKISA
jgi:hypothetical protein